MNLLFRCIESEEAKKMFAKYEELKKLLTEYVP